MRYIFPLSLLAAFTLVFACTSPPDYPIEPLLDNLYVTKDTLRHGSMQEDTTYAIFNFTDGDGDIGFADSDSISDLFVVDTRTGFVDNQYKVPFVPELGASNGIKGQISVRLFTSCCVFPDSLGLDPCNPDLPPFEYQQVVYEIYIKDRAGHQSNVLQTPPIYIKCRN